MTRDDVAALLADVTSELRADLPAKTLAVFSRRARARRDSRASYDVIAIGKAVQPMVDALAPGAASVLVVLPDGSAPPREAPNVRVLRAAHPLPDERSVAAGEAALDLAARGAGESLVVLVSGGASSLAFAPVRGVTLAEARDVFRALLHSGAEVRETNVVRRHVSRVHGGRLAQATRREVTSLIVSDVLGGAPYDVGSGPAVHDPTTVHDAHRVLMLRAPAFAELPLLESLKPGERPEVDATILLEPELLAGALARRLAHAGFAVRELRPSIADVRELAADYVAAARALGPREAIVRVAEPSVTVLTTRPGAGGRCTHLAALVARDLAPGVTFAAAATDGVDGESGTSGAVVHGASFRALPPGALDEALAAFDTAPLHLAAGTALPSAPTGVNLTDVHLLVKA
jgi:hydroxypyruvate reductase